MMMTKTVLLFVALLACIVAPCYSHPTYYPEVNSSTCLDEVNKPVFRSFHIHVLFLGYVNQSVTDAISLRDAFIAQFTPKGACPSLYHQNFLCMFDVELEPDGPFPTGQWAAFIPVERMYETVTWIMQRRQVHGWINAACSEPKDPKCGVARPAFDVLIHPNSGCEYEDHGKWMLWGGNPWLINMDAMDTEDINGAIPGKSKRRRAGTLRH